MTRSSMFAVVLSAAAALPWCAGPAAAVEARTVSGSYLEARTCQVYTGPCFANGEVNLTGKDALMAWNIAKGSHAGVDLSGLSVVLALRADNTLGHQGINDAKEFKSLIIVDERADESQRAALAEFAREHSGRAGEAVVRVENAPIQMSLDVLELTGRLEAGKNVKLVTRAARPGDCICSNESAYYPPLTKVENCAPGVAIEGEFSGAAIGSKWSIPDSRSAYMATFRY
jgi:hypothetical protein